MSCESSIPKKAPPKLTPGDDTGYEPIKDASGAVIGAYFVGYAK